MNRIIQINNSIIGAGYQPYIIAEMACAHDGSLDKAKKLIDSALMANADCIQLQFFVADETVTPHHEVYDLLKKIEFTPAQWNRIFEYGKLKRLDVFACTYDLPSVLLAQRLGVDGIKLNSADISNPDILEAVAYSKIPFTLGTGASTLEEIKNGVATLEDFGAQDMILMHGVQNFPTATEDLNIAKITLLSEQFGVPVGFADHTDGEDPFGKIVDMIAVGAGANVLEKHITLDRKKKGIDFQAALEPEEFSGYVENIKRTWMAFGSKKIKPFSQSDLNYRKFQKKSIVAFKNIQIGEAISTENVAFIRNVEPGLIPQDFEAIEGRVAKVPITKFSNIEMKDLV